MARYYIIHPNGDRFGPADVDQIRRWYDEGRLHLDWLVADEQTGVQTPIREIIQPDSVQKEESLPPRIDSVGTVNQGEDSNLHAGDSQQTGLLPGNASPENPGDWPPGEQRKPSFGQQNSPNPAPYQPFSQYPRGMPTPDAHEVDAHRWYNASVITGGFSLIVGLCACFYLALPVGLAAVVCGLVARKTSPKAGIAGIIMGSIAIILSIVLYVLLRDVFMNFIGQFAHSPGGPHVK